MSYTPGPWTTLAGDWDKDLEGYCRYTIKPLKKLNAADANLIAAAPDLFDAVIALLASAPDCDHTARAAIAKAEGK